MDSNNFLVFRTTLLLLCTIGANLESADPEINASTTVPYSITGTPQRIEPSGEELQSGSSRTSATVSTLETYFECSQILLVEKEYIVVSNGSLLLPETGEMYEMDSYRIQNGTAYVCDYEYNVTTEATSKQDSHNFSEEFLSCGHILLDLEEFHLLSNGSIHVGIYSKTYNQTDYYLQKNGVYICIPEYSEMNGSFSNGTANEVSKFSVWFVYVSQVGISVSIISLFLNILVFCVVPNVRNLPGCCLASLSFSLLCAYLCFVSSAFAVKREECAILGAIVYYFFLASFFWMNIISFDVWRSFRVVMKELRISTHRVPRRRFLVYSMYSWLVPALLVGLARVVDDFDLVPEEYKPSFGDRICWFGQRKALLVFFACPVFIIMGINAILFLDSNYIINVATMKSSQGNESVLKRRFFTFLRLALIMGLTWIVGILAGYVDQEPLWYIFVILNTLQGLFIFIVFSCSSKVRGYFRVRFCGLQRSHQGTSIRTVSSGAV